MSIRRYSKSGATGSVIELTLRFGVHFLDRPVRPTSCAKEHPHAKGTRHHRHRIRQIVPCRVPYVEGVPRGRNSDVIPMLFPLWFLLSGFLFGSLFRRLRIPWIHAGEEAFFSAAAGLGAISLSAMGLGLMGLAGPGVFSIAAAATGALGLVLWRSVRSGAKPPEVPASRAYALCLVPLLLLPLIFLPPFFYDTLHYHYGLPSIFLRSGHTVPLPYVVESYFPLGVEMLYLVGMADGGYLGANLVNVVLVALCGLGILCLADRLDARRVGTAALLLFMFSSTALYTVFLQKIDLGVTLFFFSFTYAFLLYLDSGADRRYLFLSGALAGLALGAKYTMLAFVPAVAFVGFVERHRALSKKGETGEGVWKPAPAWQDVLFFFAACAAVYSIWPARNLATVGNPVYPLLTEVFRSAGWSPAQSELLSGDAHSLQAMLHSWRDVWVLLGSVTFFPRPSVTGFGSSLGVAVIGALVFLFRRKAAPPWVFLRNVTAVSLAVWFLTSWFSRFLLPALPLMALLTGKVFDDLGRKAGRAAGMIIVGFVVLSLSAQSFTLKEPPNILKAWEASLTLPGRPGRAMALVSHLVPTLAAARFVNTRLPDNARLLFLGDTMTYYYRRDFVAPSAFDVHPLHGIATPEKNPREILRELRALGFTHVLVNWPEWRRLGDTYYRTLWPKEDRIAVERFLAGLPVVYVDGVVSIYNLGGRVH